MTDFIFLYIIIKLYESADVAELADALDLGSSTSVWGFDSLHPHQLKIKPIVLQSVFLFYIKYYIYFNFTKKEHKLLFIFLLKAFLPDELIQGDLI